MCSRIALQLGSINSRMFCIIFWIHIQLIILNQLLTWLWYISQVSLSCTGAIF